MADNIATKALHSERSLERKSDKKTPEQPMSSLPIRIVSTYGSDEDLVSITKRYEPHLSRTRSFSESGSLTSTPTSSAPPTPQDKKLFTFVKKTGVTLRSRLVKVKQLAVGKRHGKTRACHKRNCMNCAIVLDRDHIYVNGKRINSAPGLCSTYNIVYLVQCQICKKCYVGRTINTLRNRIGQHRTHFYEIVDGKNVDISKDDDYSLGVHLVHDHNLNNREDFNNNFKVFIIDNASPKVVEVKEHKYIHLLKTLRPLGINTVNPFGLSLLH